jgi:hypothetical protein
MKMQRAIEGELTTTIQALESVKARACTWRCPTRTASSANSKSPAPRWC